MAGIVYVNEQVPPTQTNAGAVPVTATTDGFPSTMLYKVTAERAGAFAIATLATTAEADLLIAMRSRAVPTVECAKA
jgi:hypothetical protein